MKIKGFIIMIGIVALMLGSCAKNSLKNAKIVSNEDSLSYAFGIVNFNALTTDSLMLDPIIVAKAMMDGKEGSTLMSDEDARAFIMAFINERESRKNEIQAELNKGNFKEDIALNEDFLAKNKEKSGVTVTTSGLQYKVVKMGKGEKPTAASTVQVHYVGTLLDGTEFDSSVKRNQPAQFPVSGVIPGWTEALQLMPVGSKFKLWIPSSLAYGAKGAGEMIKPYSTLIFEVELLDIIK